MSDSHYYPFKGYPVDSYVSPEEGREHYECGCGCKTDLRLDVRDVINTLITLLKRTDDNDYRKELREALGLPPEEG